MKTKKIFAALLFGTLMLFTSCDDNDINTTVIPVQTIRQGNIDLAGASTLAVLAGSTITNTGATSVTGDIGLSPGSSIGGFPP